MVKRRWSSPSGESCVPRRHGKPSPAPRYARELLEAFTLLQNGQGERARATAQRILNQDPSHADAWHLLGMTLHCERKHDEALLALNRAVALDRSKNATIRCTQGSVLAALGRHEEAIACFRQAIAFQGTLADAHANLGRSFAALRRFDDAEKSLRATLHIDPAHVSAWNSLGASLHQRGASREAEEALSQAIRLAPQDIPTLVTYGSVLIASNRIDEAIGVLHRAISIDPQCAAAFHNMSHALIALGHFHDAVTCSRIASQLDTAYASDYLFALSHDTSADPHYVNQEHRQWGRAFDHLSVGVRNTNTPDQNRRLRIGYVSADFRQHVMAHYLMPLLKYHDRSQFEVFCYSNVARPDHVTERLAALSDHWRPISHLDDEAAVRVIQSDQIDILVDLAGHTAGNRLTVFAHRPAPIQVTWLGYANTTGLTAIDYRIGNAFQDGSNDDSCGGTEQLIWVAGEGVCWEPPSHSPSVTELPALRNGYITFGSLHRLNKLTPTTLDVWSNLLQLTPHSRLRIFWPTLHGECRNRLAHEFLQRGIPADRLELRHEPTSGGYLNEYGDIDIGLDVFHWTGSTTTREALWMGVVVLAHSGPRRSARGSAAVLHYAGLDRFIAYSPTEYIQLATQVTSHLDELAEMRSSLRSHLANTIANPQTNLRQVETAFRTMWQKWCVRESISAPHWNHASCGDPNSLLS